MCFWVRRVAARRRRRGRTRLKADGGRLGEGQHHQVCFGFLLRAFHDDQCAGRGSLLGATDPRDIAIKVRRGGKRGEKVGSAEQRVASVETDDDVTAGLLRPNRRPTAAVTNTRTCKHAEKTETLQIPSGIRSAPLQTEGRMCFSVPRWKKWMKREHFPFSNIIAK